MNTGDRSERNKTDEKALLACRVRDRALLTGRFTLRSGAVSEVYWDKYRFESDPAVLGALAEAMQALLPTEFDKLAELELAGIPLATAISLRTGRPCLYVRKVAKSYGTANLVEGGFRHGERCVVVEDVVTSGGQVCASVRQMRQLGLVVERVVCVVDREAGGRENIGALGCVLVPLFTMRELERLSD
ncbi:MAG: orotate phosphoribosyltransferase [Chloroflexi bacterium]|nr:orotate phosphoribosyltransferase [Chloroflexota bacterium]